MAIPGLPGGLIIIPGKPVCFQPKRTPKLELFGLGGGLCEGGSDGVNGEVFVCLFLCFFLGKGEEINRLVNVIFFKGKDTYARVNKRNGGSKQACVLAVFGMLLQRNGVSKNPLRYLLSINRMKGILARGFSGIWLEGS